MFAEIPQAFKLKMREEVIPNTSVTDAKAFEEKITLAREIADVLRKNVVQARKVEEKDTWSTYTGDARCVPRLTCHASYKN